MPDLEKFRRVRSGSGAEIFLAGEAGKLRVIA
jgi:hypothetical protein